MAALEIAQSVRVARSELMRDVRAKRITLRAALDTEVAQTALAFEFVASARYSRHHTSTKRMRAVLRSFDEIGVKSYALVEELTPREKDVICEVTYLESRGRKPGSRPLVSTGITHRSVSLSEEGLPGVPLGDALRGYAARTGRLLRDSQSWCGVSLKSISRWEDGGAVEFDNADLVLSLTDLLWWEVWPPEEFPEVAAIFEPEAVAA